MKYFQIAKTTDPWIGESAIVRDIQKCQSLKVIKVSINNECVFASKWCEILELLHDINKPQKLRRVQYEMLNSFFANKARCTYTPELLWKTQMPAYPSWMRYVHS